MATFEEYTNQQLKKKKKKKKNVSAENTSFTEYTKSVLGVDDIEEPISKSDDDIAPVREETPKGTVFSKGTFEDGYQFGDVTKGVLGTVGDFGLSAVQGLANMGEGLTDLILYGAAGLDNLRGNSDVGDKIKELARENSVDNAFNDIRENISMDDASFLGDGARSFGQVLGGVGGIILTGGIGGAAGLSAAGASALTSAVVGASSMGSGMSEAYQGGATDEEAVTYGAISGAVDVVSEMLFGGLGKTVKALGVSHGLSSLDDVFAKKLSSKISNHFVKNLTQMGVKASAEGFEEVVAGVGSAIGKKLTYMDEKELSQLVEDENLLESFVMGSLAGGVFQTGDFASSIKSGRDFITGLSANEEAVVNKVYEEAVAQKEKDGKKLTNKEKNKLYEKALEDMEKGYISTDIIDEVIGGETYKTYKNLSEEAAREKAKLEKEIEYLENLPKEQITVKQSRTLEELQNRLKELENDTSRQEWKDELDTKVWSSIQGDRLTESYWERARRRQAFEADLSQYDSKQQATIKSAIDSGILNNSRKTHEFVDMVAKISADKGVSFDFANNEKIANSSFAVKGKTVNAFVTKEGNITLNTDSPKYLNSVVGHEITHVLEGSELYGELQKTLFEYAKSKGEYDSRRKDLEDLYKDIEGASIDAELTADLVGDYLFTDSDFINNLSTNNRNVFQKIYDEIKYLCKVATAGSKEARELEKVKRAFEKAYKESAKTETQDGTKHSLSDENLGYHAGDLGKAESLGSQGYDRGTGHFGRGTYFVGNKELVKDYNKRDGKQAPQHAVDFSDYNLYKVKSDKDGYDLHEQLKVIDGGINERWIAAASRDEFRLASITEWADIAKAKYGEDNVYTDEGQIYGLTELAKREGIEIPSKEQFADEQGYDLTDEYLDGDYAEHLKDIVKSEIESINNGYARFRNAYFYLNLRFGFGDKVLNAMEQVLEYQEANDRRSMDAYKKDSLATVFMKSLGYEGVDTRGTALDNVSYGSVIYDIKDNTVKYSLADKKSLDKYTQKQYNDFGWARDTEAISKNELDDMYSKIQEKGSLKKFTQSSQGEAIIEVNDKPYTTLGANNVFVFVKGTKNNPEITRIVRVNFFDEDSIEFFRKDIYASNGYRTLEAYARRIGEEFFQYYDRSNNADYRAYTDRTRSQRSGSEGEGNTLVNREGKQRSGSLEENQSNEIAPIKETSSQDGVFFDANNPKYSLSTDSNGKELSEGQKEYFKDSKVRDENGNLKVMYHGTSKGGYTVFDTYGSKYGLFGQGSYFTDNKSVAESYTNKGKGNNQQVYETYLNITNPMDMDSQANPEEWRKAFPDASFPESGTNEDFYRAAEDYFEDEGYYKYEAAEELVSALEGMGYDGITHIGGGRRNNTNDTSHQVYIAFNPEQIKNIDNTKPTGDADIRYSLSNDSEGRKLTDNQSKYFEGSKVVDDNGNLKVVYHGSPADFNEFSLKYLGTNGTAEGYGFYFTDKKSIAEGYSKGREGQQNGNTGKLFEVYLDIKKPLSDTEVTMSRADFRKFLVELNNQVDEDGEPLEFLANYGDVEWEGLNKVLNYAMEIEYDGSDSDVNMVHSVINACGNKELVFDLLRKVTGYDGIIVNEATWGGDQTIYVAFHPEQIKNVDNLNPTDNPDIRYSLSKEGETPKRYGNYAVSGKDIALEKNPMQEEVVPVEENTPVEEIAPIAEEGTIEDAPVMEEEAKSSLPNYAENEIANYKNSIAEERAKAKGNKKPSIGALKRLVVTKPKNGAHQHGVRVSDGKQYMSWNGAFVVELNTPDKSLIDNEELAVDKMKKIIESANNNVIDSGYEIDAIDISLIRKQIASDNKSVVVVGDNCYDVRWVDAVMKAIENPTVSLSKFTSDFDFLLIKGSNGQAVIAPINNKSNGGGRNLRYVYKAEKANMEQVAPEGFAPVTEEEVNRLQSESLASLDDADAPPEAEAPYYEGEEMTPSDPFEERDIKAVGNRKVKAYMYENPEVKPFFQEEAEILLAELNNTIKGERFYTETPDGNPNAWYGTESYGVWTGVSRHTSQDIAYLLDELGYTYAEIEKGIKAIIEDNGAENNACSKRIEFILNDRLMNGYPDMDYPKAEELATPPNQDYINLLNEKQILEYSEEARKSFFEQADDYAPPVEDIAPVAEDVAPVVEKVATPDKAYESIRPKKSQEPKMIRVKEGEDIAPTYETTKNGGQKQRTMFADGKVAEIIDTDTEAPKKKGGAWSWFMRNFVDKQHIFEKISLKTGNRELQAKSNHMLSSESRAQHMIGKGIKGKNGEKGVRALTDIRNEVESKGLEHDFEDYMYHMHNIDRMTLDVRFGTDNKAVYGDTVTADVSRSEVKEYEAKHPEFKRLAQDVYDYNTYLRKMLVDSGVISQETADLWADMYPHYVPIRRVDEFGASVNVPLDTEKTGVNAPVKRAVGGDGNIINMFKTMAARTEQTFRAVAKNNFGVELKNTLGPATDNQSTTVDEILDSFDKHEELLQAGKNGANPTFTVFENGERVTFEISEEMYEALKPAEGFVTKTSKTLNTVNNIRRGLITEYNPVFLTTNAIKDSQDILMNSQHAAKTYKTLPKAFKELATKGKWYTEYMENGGEQNTYFDGKSDTFKAEDKGIKKIIGIPLRAISAANNFVERAPRLAEYIASRESGASVEIAMLDAARVTTNFAAGGDVTKWANRNGATFLNASVQGAAQQVRNLREAKWNGFKGWAQLAAKFAVAGIPALLLNHLLWDDDEEYEELSDYVKDNYYIVAKYGDGQFVRIPKGRTVAVIQDAFEQIENALTGEDEVDLKNFLDLLVTNLAPNNPFDNHIFAPVQDVLENETWYGEDLVPSRLKDLPNAEQYDESTDAISKWLGETFNISPIKLNYLLDQYSGGVGDVFLPMLTPEAERGDNTLLGNIVAPFKDKFTTDSVMNNQNVADFYDTKDKLTVNAKASTATDEDILMSKYINSVSSELGELYGLKREVQNSDLPDDRKYEKVRDIQDEINALARESLNTYGDVYIDGDYAEVGDRHYRLNDEGEWTKISDKQYDKQEDVTDELGISASDYWSNKSEYDFAYENPEKYAVAKSVGGYDFYKSYMSDLYDIKADKDESGKSIRGSRKEKVAEYVNSLDIDYGERLILFKGEYKADDTYNMEIIDYLNNREDISYEEMVDILKELGFEVDSEGNITWD